MLKNTEAISTKNASPFKRSQVLIPVIIGIIVIGWLFLKEFDTDTFAHVDFNYVNIGYIFIALLFMFGRDFGMIWRFRLMSDKDLTWSQGLLINILSEFASAITPSAIGGSGFVVLFLNKEGISVGRSTTIMLTNLFLDELFFIVICPFIFLFVPLSELFNATSVITATISVFFWTLYVVLFIWTSFLYTALFHRPDLIAKVFKSNFKLPVLRQWTNQVDTFSDTMINTSYEIRKKSAGFWIKAFGTTALSWSSRFLVVNALFLAFAPINNQLVIFGRQLLLWVVMVISPSPGGSGLSEFAFKEYYNDLLLGSGPILVITLIWRIISYYLYLFLGVLILPRWFKRSFSKHHSVPTLPSIEKSNKD